MGKKTGRRYAAKQGWRTIDGEKIYFRSEWEYKYACYLQFLKSRNCIQNWEHEPQTFWFDEIKRGVRSYLPDFKIIYNDGSHEWVEIKGYMDAKSKTKIKRFGKYYPKEQLVVLGREWFKENEDLIKGIYGKEDEEREESEEGHGRVQRGRTAQWEQIWPESERPKAGDSNCSLRS